MEYDRDKLDEVVMALLYFTSFDDRGITRAWKGHDWDVLNRLFEKGWIHDPKSKAKSVAITEEGVRASADLFKKHFAI
jgi:predicted transcriptional regulator